MASNWGQGGKSAGRRRFALLAFGSLLALLFVGFAIVQGIGQPSPSSGEVAIVEDGPEGTATITEEDLEQAIERTVKQSGQPAPKPGDPAYAELRKATLESLLDLIWIQGEAEELGISVTPKEVSKEFEKLRDQTFKTEKQYQEYLEKEDFTQEEIDEQIKVQMLSERIQKLVSEPGDPSEDEIEDFYEAAKTEEFTAPETREIRIVKSEDKAKVEEAKAALKKDDSVKSWEKMAEKYSIDLTKAGGGLKSGVREGTLGEPLDAAVFAAPEGEIEGPLQEGKLFVLFEVMGITPEATQSLEEVESMIVNHLGEEAQQQAEKDLFDHYTDTWTSRTFCASDLLIERCANFEADGRPLEADEACFEADPKKPATDCPAPVAQAKPALPGSVTPRKPEGTTLAQRPIPVGLDPEAPAAEPAPPTLAP